VFLAYRITKVTPPLNFLQGGLERPPYGSFRFVPKKSASFPQILTSSQFTVRLPRWQQIPATKQRRDPTGLLGRHAICGQKPHSAGLCRMQMAGFCCFDPSQTIYEEKMLAPSSNHHPKISLYTWSIFNFLAIVLLIWPDIWEMNIQLQDRKENRPTYHKKQFLNNSRHGSITDVQFHIIKLVWQLISSANIIVCVVGKTLSGSLALDLSGNTNTHMGPKKRVLHDLPSSSLCEIVTLRYISHF